MSRISDIFYGKAKMLFFSDIFPQIPLLSSISDMILRTSSDLARLVHDRRRELGLTQEELANLTGLHRTAIGMLEKGQRSVRFESMLRILHTLGMDLDVRTRGG
jgi:y4mF family transcriptional regulator